MHRFFVSPTCVTKASVYFPMDVCHQIANVLHLRSGQRVMVLDNTGMEHEVELEIVAPRSTEGRILASHPAEGEPGLSIQLYLGLTQREKFEWILQKCTEIGVTEFVPVISSRSLVQSADDVRSKQERWQRILQEAAEQSGRGRIPNLAAALRWEEALAQFQASGIPGVVAWEGEKAMRMAPGLAAHKNTARLAVFIGPEGGYSESEIGQAQAAGLTPVTLGKRILRMETAAVVATTLILREFDEL
jgi:16S rRNA (uracil1498-N3)-methyltransferase